MVYSEKLVHCKILVVNPLFCRLQKPRGFEEKEEEEKKGNSSIKKTGQREKKEIFAGPALAHESQHDTVRGGRTLVSVGFQCDPFNSYGTYVLGSERICRKNFQWSQPTC